jgi:hypothetical protein
MKHRRIEAKFRWEYVFANGIGAKFAETMEVALKMMKNEEDFTNLHEMIYIYLCTK